MKTISAQQLSERLASGQADLIDVRTPAEYREVHIQGARNVPLDSLDPGSVMESRNGRRDQPLYVMCKAGSRGSKACQAFIDRGYDQVINLDGGVQAWEAAQDAYYKWCQSRKSGRRWATSLIQKLCAIACDLCALRH